MSAARPAPGFSRKAPTAISASRAPCCGWIRRAISSRCSSPTASIPTARATPIRCGARWSAASALRRRLREKRPVFVGELPDQRLVARVAAQDLEEVGAVPGVVRRPRRDRLRKPFQRLLSLALDGIERGDLVGDAVGRALRNDLHLLARGRHVALHGEEPGTHFARAERLRILLQEAREHALGGIEIL